jgi:hypothetical protein
MPSPWIAVVAVLIVVAVSLWLRRATGAGVEQTGSPTAGLDGPPDLLDEDADPDPETTDDEGDPGERVPVTAEGIALVRTGSQVALISLVQSEDMPEWVRGGIEDSSVPYQVVNQIYGQAAHGSHGARPGMILNAGDFTAARIRRDAGAGLWCLETLGRDGDYGFFPFETDAGARTALAMLQKLGIVRVELDEDQQPVPPSREDFEEARRRYDETERALALENDPGEGLSPGTYSDRR